MEYSNSDIKKIKEEEYNKGVIFGKKQGIFLTCIIVLIIFVLIITFF